MQSGSLEYLTDDIYKSQVATKIMEDSDNVGYFKMRPIIYDNGVIKYWL